MRAHTHAQSRTHTYTQSCARTHTRARARTHTCNAEAAARAVRGCSRLTVRDLYSDLAVSPRSGQLNRFCWEGLHRDTGSKKQSSPDLQRCSRGAASDTRPMPVPCILHLASCTCYMASPTRGVGRGAWLAAVASVASGRRSIAKGSWPRCQRPWKRRHAAADPQDVWMTCAAWQIGRHAAYLPDENPLHASLCVYLPCGKRKNKRTGMNWWITHLGLCKRGAWSLRGRERACERETDRERERERERERGGGGRGTRDAP